MTLSGSMSFTESHTVVLSEPFPSGVLSPLLRMCSMQEGACRKWHARPPASTCQQARVWSFSLCDPQRCRKGGAAVAAQTPGARTLCLDHGTFCLNPWIYTEDLALSSDTDNLSSFLETWMVGVELINHFESSVFFFSFMYYNFFSLVWYMKKGIW